VVGIAIAGLVAGDVVEFLVRRRGGGRVRAANRSRYWATGPVTAALFTGVVLRFGLVLQLPAYLFLITVGMAAALIDFDKRPLPDELLLPAYVISVLLLMPADAASGNFHAALRGVIGLLTCAAIYFLLRLAYPSALLAGDVKLAGLIGLYLGWLGLAALLLGAVLGLALTAGGGLARSVIGPRHAAGAMALAPCMVAAAILALFLTVPTSTWFGTVLAVAR
jgi:leader peptidase (prepilin peptidase)/N-methyltransferase